MKVLFLALCVALSLGARLSSPPNSPTLEQQNEELDEFTAYQMESLGAFDDDDDDVAEDGEDDSLMEDDVIDDDDLPQNDVVYANMTEDGMIEVEDMVVSPDMFGVLFPHVSDHPDNTESSTIHRRAAVSSSAKRWPGAKVYYAYNNNLAGSKTKVRAAMNEWEKYTCVRFVYRPSGSTKYTQIRTPDTRCSSTLGYTGRRQYINLGKNCFSHKTLLHEIGHTLGLIHEHQHPDRDRYVTIYWGNVDPVKTSQFQFKRSGTVSSYGYAYDVRSIMHYSSTSFKKNGCKSPCYTIKSKSGSTYTNLMGRSTHLSSRSDIPIVKKIYGCPTSGY